MMELKVVHLYPRIMNLYGDRGNITALAARCRWRGIKFIYTPINLGEPLPDKFDFVFLGGGQDREQRLVGADLPAKKERLRAAAEDGVVMLAVCGGYQMFGKVYRPAAGRPLTCLGILDVETRAGDKRLIGNIVINSRVGGRQIKLVGFENHGGKSYVGARSRPLGRVEAGYGNNGEDGWEGAVYKNVFGTYLHGSLLPKNPRFTDYLLTLALKRRYGQVELTPLDDTLETAAHQAAVKLTKAVE